ncbi:MAG: DNA polymerase III subunit gamma/tau [Tannerellaceae bacterium]|jgi:DNA polymerase-3 subunit gamma/tau|nr:DNA polymerase III subunit gamma/tau [Tannerellaceae bacterium]
MENYIVSARKYRPLTFQSVVGQKTLTVTLKNAIQNNKLAHAYLFCGPRGVGKTSCARIFAKTINCLSPSVEGEACNACESCRAFNEQRSLNIHELDAASNNSVDDIRILTEQVRVPPPLGKYKVFIIDEVHMLSQQAFNAFLKTLEEPPRHAIFILATTEKHKVIPTILSRCQIYDFARITVADIVDHLQYVASIEGVTAEAEALNVIAAKADGGMRDALSIFDQAVSFTEGNVTYKAVIENLNVLDYDYYFRMTEAILSGNISECLLLLDEILRNGFEGQNVITGLASHFRDLLVCKDKSTVVLLEVGASIRDRYATIADRCPESFLFRALELSNQCDLNYRISRNKKLLLELTLIQLCNLNCPLADSAPEGKTVVPTSASVSIPIPVQAQSLSVPPVMPAPPPSPSKKQASPVSTSLKNMAANTGKKELSSHPVGVNLRQPFTEEDLHTHWLAYAETIKKKVHLYNTMTSCKPVLGEDSTFDVTVPNPGLQDELAVDSGEILSYLREKLKNAGVMMRVKVNEESTNRIAVTAAEKYEYLRNINPLVDELKKNLQLTLE